MKVLLLGATGRTGKLILEIAVAKEKIGYLLLFLAIIGIPTFPLSILSVFNFQHAWKR